MNKNSKDKKFYSIILGILIVMGCFSFVVLAAGWEPGSQEDPIVTKSYVDQKIQQIQGSGEGGSSVGTSFASISVPAGKKLIGGEGTEIILRTESYSATAIVPSTAAGNITNITQGTDLANGAGVSKDHLLIIPRNDGRGILAKKDIHVMVKGTYSIQ